MKSKIHKIAQHYARAHAYYHATDCCDSMRDCERIEAQWEVLTDGDEESLVEYVRKNCKSDYLEALREIVNEQDDQRENCPGTPIFWFGD